MYIIIHAHCKIVLTKFAGMLRGKVLCGVKPYFGFTLLLILQISLWFSMQPIFFFLDEIWHFWNLNMVCWLNIKT